MAREIRMNDDYQIPSDFFRMLRKKLREIKETGTNVISYVFFFSRERRVRCVRSIIVSISAVIKIFISKQSPTWKSIRRLLFFNLDKPTVYPSMFELKSNRADKNNDEITETR